jgi:hypothetical protein
MVTISDYPTPLGRFGDVLKFLTRFLQLILSTTITAIYGIEIHRAESYKGGWDHMFAFATFIAGITGLTALFFMLPKVKSYNFWALDGIYVMLWAIVAGVFAGAFLGKTTLPLKDAPGTIGPGRGRMRVVAGLDLFVLGLWVHTWVAGGVHWWRVRRDVMSHQDGRRV